MAADHTPGTPTPPQSTDQPFIISRTFAAPRALVFKAWTEHERIVQWMAPGGGSGAGTARGSITVGETYHYSATFGGRTSWGKWVVRELVPPERLVYLQAFSDEQGGLTRHPMNPDWPLQMLTTVLFSEKDGQTTVRLEWKPFEANATERAAFAAGFPGMTKGWGGSLDRLAALLGTTSG